MFRINPLQDARLEAEREVAVYRAYLQDATLSTNAREWRNTKYHKPHLHYFARKYLPFPVGKEIVSVCSQKRALFTVQDTKRCFHSTAK